LDSRLDRGGAQRHQDIHRQVDEGGGQRGEPLVSTLRIAVLERKVPTLRVAELAQPGAEPLNGGGGLGRGRELREHADPGDVRRHRRGRGAPSLAGAIYSHCRFAEAGGLMAYGPKESDPSWGFQRAAVFVDKILKGAKPADLPVDQPTTFELVINLKTAKALGLTIPLSLLFQANEVIQ
jgi:hypothetical protein